MFPQTLLYRLNQLASLSRFFLRFLLPLPCVRRAGSVGGALKNTVFCLYGLSYAARLRASAYNTLFFIMRCLRVVAIYSLLFGSPAAAVRLLLLLRVLMPLKRILKPACPSGSACLNFPFLQPGPVCLPLPSSPFPASLFLPGIALNAC